MKHYIALVWLESGPSWTTLSECDLRGMGWRDLEGTKQFMRDFLGQEPPAITGEQLRQIAEIIGYREPEGKR